jgi:hypothetical protein
MANNPNVLKNLKNFTSTYQPPNAGRKPSKLKKFIKDNGLSSWDVACMIKIVFATSEDDLKKMLQDKTRPMMLRLFIKAYLNDFLRGDLKNWLILSERAFGKAIQPIDNSGVALITELTKEQRDARIAELLKKRGDLEPKT